MAIFTNQTYQSRSLGEHYVFYENLKKNKDSGLKSTYYSIQNRLTDYMESRADYKLVGQRLIDFAEVEFNKEQEYLHNIFGASKMKFYSLGNAQEFADTLTFYNDFLNYKDIFKRNIERIQHYTKGKIDISSFGASAMSDAWKDLMKERIPDIIEQINKKGLDEAINIIVQQTTFVLNNELAERTVSDMFNSETFNKKEKVEHDGVQAYKELSEKLGYMGRTELGQQLMQLYGAEDLKNWFLDIIIGTEDNNNKVTTVKQLKKRLEKAISETTGRQDPNFTNKNKGFYQIGFDNRKTGISSELIETAKNKILNGIANSPTKGRFSIDVNVGGKNARPDEISISCKAKYSPQVYSAFDEYNAATGMNSRTKAAEVTRKFSAAIDAIEGAVIIYENTKNNYMGPLEDILEEDKLYKKFSGFSSGSSSGVSAAEIGDIMGDPQRAGAIYQTIKGAIGSNITDYEEKVRASLAEDIAYFLFDDFEVKGNAAGITTSSSLHIFSLVGIKVPLSFLLYQLGKTFSESVNPIDAGMIELTISKPKKPSEYDFGNGKGEQTMFPSNSIKEYNYLIKTRNISDPWNKQREHAEKYVKIHFNFFKNFFSMIKGVNFTF